MSQKIEMKLSGKGRWDIFGRAKLLIIIETELGELKQLH